MLGSQELSGLDQEVPLVGRLTEGLVCVQSSGRVLQEEDPRLETAAAQTPKPSRGRQEQRTSVHTIHARRDNQLRSPFVSIGLLSAFEETVRRWFSFLC